MKPPSTREVLLAALKSARGRWMPGDVLCAERGISRAAVSKHIKRLRREGYAIESFAGKGHRLVKAPDTVRPEEIRQDLGTRVFGQGDIVYFTETDSTNSQARQRAEAGAAEGTLVVAECQTAGRGRRGRAWVSPEGAGIYLSLIARPRISPAEAPRLTLLTAVAAADAVIAETGVPVRIKWPNDLLVDGRKLAGILTEIRTEMDLVDYVVIGIGINANTPETSLSAIRDQKCTSLWIETGNRIDRASLLRRFLSEFEACYETFLTEGFASILTRWKAHSAIIGEAVAVDVAGTTHRGRVKDVEDSGVLLLEDEQGKTRRIFSGDLVIEH